MSSSSSSSSSSSKHVTDAEVATSFLSALHVPQLQPPVQWACTSCQTISRDPGVNSVCEVCKNPTSKKLRAYVPMGYRIEREK